jgi:hypothetical protein
LYLGKHMGENDSEVLHKKTETVRTMVQGCNPSFQNTSCLPKRFRGQYEIRK